ncbi:terpene synthase family protein [Amycolatopsis anabasis]|uniref:terpene synthase family protein n=1 Tax=Amycolatopsis anabasis TaxID=1840409 RepID=UPI00131D17A7|nr:terpene synthase family protein [Amycolatopsis anabasis]
MTTSTASVVSRNIKISYPRSWSRLPGPVLYQEPEATVTAWLDRLGMLTTPESRAAVRKAWNGYRAAASYPGAVRPRLNTIAKFLGLWFLYEDGHEGVLRGWREIGHELRSSMSEEWCRRFGKHFDSWRSWIPDEVELVARKGHQSTLHEYLTVRFHTIGVHTWTDLIEFAHGRELPGEVLWHPDFQEIQRLTHTLAIIDHDLHGLTRDHERGWHNAVFSMAHERELSLADACEALSRLHDILVRQFLTLEQRVRACAEYELDWWIDGVHQMLTGLCLWNQAAPRCSNLHHLDGTAIRIRTTHHVAWPSRLTAEAT